MWQHFTRDPTLVYLEDSIPAEGTADAKALGHPVHMAKVR